MKRILFIDNPAAFEDTTAFVAHIGHVKGKRELCHQLSEKLQFPLLVNSHWDALWDFLRDFNWIGPFKIILVHDCCIQLDQKDFHTYFEILIDVINDWKKGEEHEFEVIFPAEYESIIRPLEDKYSKEVEERLKQEIS